MYNIQTRLSKTTNFDKIKGGRGLINFSRGISIVSVELPSTKIHFWTYEASLERRGISVQLFVESTNRKTSYLYNFLVIMQVNSKKQAPPPKKKPAPKPAKAAGSMDFNDYLSLGSTLLAGGNAGQLLNMLSGMESFFLFETKIYFFVMVINLER